MGGALLAVGSMSWAVAQWLLVWMFARFAGGADAVGEYALVLSIATPVFTVAQFGLRTVYLSLRVEYPWRTYLTLRVIGTTAATALLIAYFVATEAADPAVWAALLAVKVADLFFDLWQARIQRTNRLAALGVLNIANSVGTIALAGVALATTGSVAVALAASALVSIGVALAGRQLAASRPSESHGDRGYREILRAGAPTTVSESLAAFASYLPVLVLSLLADETLVGVFAAAAYILTFANLVGAILKNVLITPFRQTLESVGEDHVRHRAHRLALGLGAASSVAALTVALFGGPVLRVIYGPEFEMPEVPLILLAVAVIPIASSYIYSTFLNVTHRFSGQAWIWVLALTIGILAGAISAVVGVGPLETACAVALASSWARFGGALILACRR
ncbi:lipopolysaccharide biosynthesis protein [Microbacterium sp. 3J1]|uniref:lipopolysaccharide biosynthesis protein n=1 Tax=Microbacterium sp. 3J1 TaxID=861269 RepID=UPI00159EE142|nr:oligosaccharide flippase family protein [Microbacterium sp. 3J1]